MSQSAICANPNLHINLKGQIDQNSRYKTDIGDLRTQLAAEDDLYVVTPDQLMLDILLKHQAQWNTQQRLEQQKIVAKLNQMAAKWDQSAAEYA